MRMFAFRRLLYVTVSLFFCASFLHGAAIEKESLRLLVSAGVLAEPNPFLAFYQSRIFKGDESPPFVITNADAFAFENDDAIFYPTSEIATATNTRMLVGQSYRGILLSGAADEKIRRHLGADNVSAKIEQQKINGTSVIAISKSSLKKIAWPKSFDELRRVPAVIIEAIDKKSRYVLVGRSIGALAHRLGVIDRILAKKSSPVGFIDLGTSHTGAIFTPMSLQMAEKHPQLFVFAGSLELLAMLGDKNKFAKLNLVAPLGDRAKLTMKVADEVINLWSVTHNENVWPLYENLGKRLTITDAINQMKNEKSPTKALNVVRVYSEDAARIAAAFVDVHLVLLLANDPYAQLPSREIIELRQSETDAYEQIAPIVRISNLDASELFIYQKGSQKIQRIEVVRQGFSDEAPRAIDVPLYHMPASAKTLAKPSPKVWEKSDLEKVLGGIMLSETKADIAIFSELLRTTTIHGDIPYAVAKSLMNQHGNTVIITISGRQVKRIAKLISSERFSRKHALYGLDARGATIGNRPINDRERFVIALTEEALLDLFGLSRLGGLGEDYALRAPFVAAVYADSRQLFYIGGQKMMPIADTADEIERAVREIKAGLGFDEMMERGFLKLSKEVAQNYIDRSLGRPHHVVTLDIANFDIGISKNIANKNYEDRSSSFPTSRGSIKPYTHFFVFSKIALNYETPVLFSSLFNEIKYMHTDLNDKPERDKVRLGLKLRLPWEQTYFKDKDIVVSPIFNNVYETKLTPHPWADNAKIRMKPRPRRIDSLLGINVDFTKLGFNFDIGAGMATDFNRTTLNDAIDLGPGLNFFSKWRLFGPLELSSEISAVYLFALPKNQALNKLALNVEGTVWLRVARFYDFGVDLMSDFLLATLQEAPKQLIAGSIFGLTISYGRLFRLLG